MAINFPDSPTNGQSYTDAGTGQTWTYELATNSWTASTLATTGGVVYKGNVDITAAPPTSPKAGEQWSIGTGGTANAGYGPGVTGTITKGGMVMYTGSGWLETSHSVPDATIVAKGIDTLKWNRNGTVLSPATAGDAVNIGGTNISLKATDGSSAFASRIAVGSVDNGATFTNSYGITAYNSSDDSTIWARNSKSGKPVYTGVNAAGIFTSQIFENGSATFAGTVTATVVPPSDARFKENITPANPQLADVVALGKQLKNFDWNDKAPLDDELRSVRQLGLIAQEAERVSPGIVKTIKRTKQGKELTPEQVIPAVYEDRQDPQDEENFIQVEVTPEQVIPATYEELDDSYKGISHDALIMKLLGAIAELEAKVTALEGGAPAKSSDPGSKTRR